MLIDKAQSLTTEIHEHRAEVLEWLRQHPREFEVAVLMYRSLELCGTLSTELWNACGSEMALKFLIESEPDQSVFL